LSAVELNTFENLDRIGVDADIIFDGEARIPAIKIGDLALLNNTIAISAEIDENEMILGRKLVEDSLSGKVFTTSLRDSLARVQSALDLLAQVAARTKNAVAALETQRAAQ
jgi:hypothetical protein